ncbi:8-oxo-dGTP pyrophosphatase MutT (NUDIX family) [Streptacidiphilus sp. MAP12-33]|uniref:VOC family protein n=1 Tax=Streptacidiphilus sp. MAP12-33 TaxID=3156266 RepID=UPI0035164E93
MTHPLNSDEILDVVDAEDRVVGQAPRGEVMAKRLRHRCVFILATDTDGRIFVHRRTPQKIVFPSMYDVFVGGVVGTGESYDEAAKREAEEELGVTGIEPEHLFTFLYTSADHEWFSAVYRATTPVHVAPQAEEVAWHAFLTEAELEAALPGWDVVPDGLDAWRRLARWQESAARRVPRPEASAAVSDLGWRYLLGTLRTAVPTGSLAEAAAVAVRAAALCGRDADGHLGVELRRDRALLSLQSAAQADVTERDLELARRLSAELPTRPLSLQLVELAIDALDIAAVRPFWKAVLGYVGEPGHEGPTDALVDPLGHGPAVWFQQMDAPRPQRNRIHFDVCVPHDVAADRIAATLAAGGTLLDETAAPAFWVLADAEGNEACVTTWQGRD